MGYREGGGWECEKVNNKNGTRRFATFREKKQTDSQIYIQTDRQRWVGECNSFIRVQRSLASCKCVHSWMLPRVSVWLTLHLLHLCSRKQPAAYSTSSSSLRGEGPRKKKRKKRAERKKKINFQNKCKSAEKRVMKQLFKHSAVISISAVQWSPKMLEKTPSNQRC